MKAPHASDIYRHCAKADFEQTNSKRSKPSKMLEDMPDSEEDRGRSMSE